MCTINTDLLYKGKYAIRVCNENARQLCRLLSKLFGCKYEDIRRVVSESIFFMPHMVHVLDTTKKQIGL